MSLPGWTPPFRSITLIALLTINSITITGTNSGDFAQTNNCDGGLTVGMSCTINVTFTPTAKGLRKGSLTISDSAPDSPHVVGLTGTGT